MDAIRTCYVVTLANDRRVVLTAFQDVEDGITGVIALDHAWKQSQRAIISARQVLQIVSDRYEGSIATYLDVITAQQSAQCS